MPLDVTQVTVDDFIAARWFYPGRQRKVRLGVLHATQSPERKRAARGVANDFANRPPSNKASAHVVCDDAETIGCVKPGDTAFAVPSANADGFHIEQVGYSEQQLLDWQDDYSQKVIARAAACAREASAVFDLPLVWLDVAEVARGDRGWTDHATCSKALGGTHWDPGPDYPRDQFMQLLTGGSPAPSQEDFMAALTDDEQHALFTRVAAIQQQADRLEHALKTLLGPDEDGTDERVSLFDPVNGLYAKVTALDTKLDTLIAKG